MTAHRVFKLQNKQSHLLLFLFQLKEYSQKAVEILRAQNHNLTNHPNSNIYKYVTSPWSF